MFFTLKALSLLSVKYFYQLINPVIMKKIVTTLAVVALAFTLASCGMESKAKSFADDKLELKIAEKELRIRELELAIEVAEYTKDMKKSEREDFYDIYGDAVQDILKDDALEDLDDEIDELQDELSDLYKD